MASLDTSGMTDFGRQGFNNAGKQDQIFIVRDDLLEALYYGSHYESYAGGSIFSSESVDVEITNALPHILLPRRDAQSPEIVKCTLRDDTSQSLVELDFEKLPRGNTLKFHGGIKRDETKNRADTPIQTAQDLTQVLIQIYRSVRSEADPKWAADYAMRLEAREVAAQQLDTGMLPKMPVRAGQNGTMVIGFERPAGEPRRYSHSTLCRLTR